MKWRVKRGSSTLAADAAVFFSSCHTISACSTQVLPVPVAILKQYLGWLCLGSDTSASPAHRARVLAVRAAERARGSVAAARLMSNIP